LLCQLVKGLTCKRAIQTRVPGICPKPIVQLIRLAYHRLHVRSIDQLPEDPARHSPGLNPKVPKLTLECTPTDSIDPLNGLQLRGVVVIQGVIDLEAALHEHVHHVLFVEPTELVANLWRLHGPIVIAAEIGGMFRGSISEGDLVGFLPERSREALAYLGAVETAPRYRRPTWA
jgi:hypothetical protein